MMRYMFLLLIFLIMGFTQMEWAGTVTSNGTGGGNWSIGATWNGGSAPGTTDDAVIADGDLVTIDQAVTVASLTVGGGASGILTFNNVVHAVTVNGNITVNNGAKFTTGFTTTGDLTITSTTIANVGSTANLVAGMGITGTGIPAATTVTAFTVNTITLSAAATASGTGVSLAIGYTVTNTMSIAGDMTNNGTFDMSMGTSTALCNVTFNKTGDQTISGTTPVLTQFRGITLSKSVVGNRVVANINVSMAGSQLFVLTAGTWEQTAGTLAETSGSQSIAAAGSLIISGTGNFNMVIAGSIAVTGNLTVNTSGTFSLGSGNNSITTVTGSTIILTAGTINIYGRLTLTLGTTTINGAAINIYQQSTNLLAATSNAFECSGTANLTFSSGSVTIVDPNGSGDDSRTGRDIKITTSTTVNLTGSTFYLGDGVSTKTCTNPGTTGTGFIFGNLSSAPIPVMYNVIIRGGGIAGRNALMKTSLTVGNVLTLTSGTITLSSSNLIINSGGSISGASSSNYVIANGAGTLNQSVGSGAVFPIGDVAYRPVTLASVTGTSPVISARVMNANAGGTFDGTLGSISPVRYWAVGLVSGSFTAGTVNLVYGSDDGITDNANLNMGTSATLAGTYTSLGGIGSANISGNITSNSIGSLGTPAYFLLANAVGGTNPMPVELSSFTATLNGRNVKLNWETKTEVAFNKFEIDRAFVSTNGTSVNWTSVGSVPASGSSNSPRKYSYTEMDLQTGKNQFRLKMIDNDGSYKFSNVVEIEISLPGNYDLSQNFPNPFNPSTKINYTLPYDSKVILEIYNINGERIGQLVNEEQSAGYYSVDFSASSINRNISSGVYFYRITAVNKVMGNNFSSIKKMVLLK
jgi:hypothetical protein